ncbi:MAG: acyltransferase [Xanthobacteraceae bacterium]|nr:acyltransferase [Xanthobacteraceae bacterium]
MKHEPTPHHNGDIAAFSRSRSFVTLLVVVYHAASNYIYFGNGDHQRWIGFDIVVLFADSFFMPLMFFISGLFVFSSLTHRGPTTYLRDRLWRLGIPFLISIFILMPIAYYPSFLIYHWPGTTDFSFIHFWERTLTVGPWPSGPSWFLWVLIVFDLLAVIVWSTARASLQSLGSLIAKEGTRPASVFAGILIITLLAYMPFALLFGRDQWFAAGPISIQASRIGLYATCFLLGTAAGSVPFTDGVLAERGAVARGWPAWVCIAALAFVALAVLSIGESGGYALRCDMSQQAVLKAIVFSVFSASTGIATLGVALRFANNNWAFWRFLDAMNPVAYGIFLTHFIFIIWLQYVVYTSQMPATFKFVVVFLGALSGGWIVTRVLRSIPAVSRMI